jgi:hypothetical protein
VAYSFEGRSKRKWNIELNVATGTRVRNEAKIDLGRICRGEFDLLVELLNDPFTLGAVLYCCAQPDDKKDFTPEEFGGDLAGDAIGHATEAFKLTLVDFFQNPGRREAVKKLLQVQDAATRKAFAKMQVELSKIDPEKEADAAIAKAESELSAGKTSGESAGGTPASSASTPGHAP